MDLGAGGSGCGGMGLDFVLKMKIVADKNIPFLKGRLERAGAEVLYVDQFGFTPDLVRDADALLIRTRTPINEALLAGSKVGVVATATIGTDQIDFDFTRKAGITVCNAPGCNAPAVAQYVWSSLLRCGFNPAEDILGVVGKGNVGRIVVEWGRVMGARVLVCDPPRQRAGLTDEEYLPLRDMLGRVDAVTFHTPLTLSGSDATFHLAGAGELDLIKRGAVLVNAARGPVVDNGALCEALAAKRLRAVVDTWEGEPNLNLDLLSRVEFGSCHIAGYSRQGKERATRMVLEAVENFFGIVVDKSGLEGPYAEPARLTPQLIMDSFDPAVETDALRREPDKFDILRNNYILREEVS